MPSLNWQINVVDVISILGVAFLLYGRLVDIETKMKVLWGQFEAELLHKRNTDRE